MTRSWRRHSAGTLRRRVAILIGLSAFATSAWWIVASARDAESTEARAQERQSAKGNTEDGFADAIRPIVEQCCSRCHDKKHAKGDIILTSTRTADELRAAADDWRLVIEQLDLGEMPPSGEARPSRERLAAMRSAIARLLDAEGTQRRRAASHPGNVTLRRLNRVEYENTIRDLFAYEFHADETLPADDVGYGFDNIGDVLSASPLLLDKYADAAERIAEAVLPNFETGATVDGHDGDAASYSAADMQIQGGASLRRETVWMSSTATASARHAFVRTGRYQIQCRALGQQAGSEPVKIRFSLDGRALAVRDVTASAPEPQDVEVDAFVDAGRHTIGVTFINDYYQPQHPDPKQRDRNCGVRSIRVRGPLERPRYSPLRHAYVERIERGVDAKLAFEDWLIECAERVWRGPLDVDERAHLLDVANRVAGKDASVTARARVALEYLLVSPRFLFRFEQQATAESPVVTLNSFELATRLSYFLWSSTPDDALLASARRGELDTPAGLVARARTMLDDPRSIALAQNFATQWLQIGSLDHASPDPGRFPGVDAELLAWFRAETIQLFDYVLRQGRPVAELIDADYGFVNERLAEHYGLVGVRGPYLRRVRLPAERRGGVLTQGSVLTATSNPTRTSPVKRGKWLLESLLDSAPPPPPPGVGSLDAVIRKHGRRSMREMMAIHRQKPECATCHDRMDAYGLSLERYDAVGRYRQSDFDGPIDATTQLPDGRTIDGLDGLRQVLHDDPGFHRSLSKHLLTYALGRGLTRDDGGAIAHLIATLDADPTLPALIAEIVQLDAFRKRAYARPVAAESEPRDRF